jgi:hypothetical protein
LFEAHSNEYWLLICNILLPYLDSKSLEVAMGCQYGHIRGTIGCGQIKLRCGSPSSAPAASSSDEDGFFVNKLKFEESVVNVDTVPASRLSIAMILDVRMSDSKDEVEQKNKNWLQSKATQIV